MSFKVLVVDDSSFFRRRVTDILNNDPELEVIDVAINGLEAVKKAIALKPDVITMDIEMPLLNGIDAVKQIMAQAPTAIIMFSSLTHSGAKATLEALDAGALDFLPKKFNEIAKTTEDAGSLLRQRVKQLARKKGAALPRISTFRSRAAVDAKANSDNTTSARTSKATADIGKYPNESVNKKTDKSYKLLAIGTSTGGPVALQQLLVQLPKDFPLPIILIQHMPATFTSAFASRLNTLCKISIKEASSGDILKPGHAYLAPGGKQMIIDGTENAAKLRILEDNSERIAFKPSVDISFASAAKVFGGNVLGVILTGMGADGRDGSRLLKNKGATIWSQDEESCVVYGMPQAVTVAGISERSLAIDSFPSAILKEIQHG
ncbi:protein-glutamate methylesterase/protein-glutamine glutaminase [Colwellia polaris]|jgi:two-component system chemotaxis response regulator CheB|uniref:protein-glutamate methylesterase/protein-glutamine glutaminase n=1 Tax=Colwellia polaris TaxID=326537 RepID=UPI000A1712FA|nr:chemotaxis response regulator protein-glutamate methylesterase [Colwellia polaris]|tara:strand:+ start:1873 stop:3003 length:1131 start_codon:yes stop_codon:yes gene_type:complete